MEEYLGTQRWEGKHFREASEHKGQSKSRRSLDCIDSSNKSQGVLCDTRGVYSPVLSTSLSK